MNTMKMKGHFNLELTNHEVMEWEYRNHAPGYMIPPAVMRFMGMEIPAQREIPLAKPSWTIIELEITVDMYQCAGVSNDTANALAHWANIKYEDDPDAYYNHVEVEYIRADYKVRTITFTHAYVKRYEEVVDSEAGTWIATMLLEQKQDMSSKVMVNGKAVNAATRQQNDSLNIKPRLDSVSTVVNRVSTVVIRKVDEELDADILAKVNTKRKSLPKPLRSRYTFGYADVEINGLPQSDFFAHSAIHDSTNLSDNAQGSLQGISLKADLQEFPTKSVNEKDMVDAIDGWNRNVDAESKILEDINRKLSEVENPQGKICLYTDLYPCLSCRDVIAMFKKKHPKIDLLVIYKKRIGVLA